MEASAPLFPGSICRSYEVEIEWNREQKLIVKPHCLEWKVREKWMEKRGNCVGRGWDCWRCISDGTIHTA